MTRGCHAGFSDYDLTTRTRPLPNCRSMYRTFRKSGTISCRGFRHRRVGPYDEMGSPYGTLCWPDHISLVEQPWNPRYNRVQTDAEFRAKQAEVLAGV
jgi:hypothetical protein